AVNYLVQEQFACGALAGSDLCCQDHTIVLYAQDILGLKSDLLALVPGERATEDDVGILVRGELIGAVALEFFTDLRSNDVRQAGLEGSIHKGDDLDGLFPRADSVRGTELVAGAAAQAGRDEKTINRDGPKGRSGFIRRHRCDNAYLLAVCVMRF